MNLVGQRILRVEDPRFLTGRGAYIENMPAGDALHVTFVRAPVAHATIAEIDVSAARALPGVRVFTAREIELAPLKPIPVDGMDRRMTRSPVADERVRFAGEIVAAVVAPTRARSVDAAELVLVDYEQLPAVTDPRAALRGDVLLYPELGSNVCFAVDPLEVAALFDGCDLVVEGSLTSQRLAPAPLEPRSVRVGRDERGRLTAWLCTQTPHQDRDQLVRALKLERDSLRVVAPDVGGGFGAKKLAVEDVLLVQLARLTGETVCWTETRSENMLAMQHGRGAVLDFELGGTRDGELLAYRLNVIQDAGAYPELGAWLPTFTKLMASGCYAIPRIAFAATAVVTNATPVGPFRGAGRPEAAQAIERAIDLFASELGADPAEIRRRNFIGRASFPFRTASGADYDSGDYERTLDAALAAAGYEELRREQAARHEAGAARRLGVGLSTYVEVTNGGPEGEFGAVEITPEGGAVLRTGSFSHGQGHETTFAMIVADRLGLPLEAIRLVKGDTDAVARGMGTYGSKSTQIGGVAASEAAAAVVELGAVAAADLLEISRDDVVFDRTAGRFHGVGAPALGLGWAELAERLAAEGRLGELQAEHDFKPDGSTFPFGAHVAVVEVDTETGQVDLLRFVAVDDAGTIVNPVIADGQVHGGLATGIAQALFEGVAYDEDGNPLAGSLLSYAFPSAAELPSFERIAIETPTPLNPLGVKGIGESGTIGATPAVLNAVLDALAPLGVRQLEMPVSGEAVWRALSNRA